MIKILEDLMFGSQRSGAGGQCLSSMERNRKALLIQEKFERLAAVLPDISELSAEEDAIAAFPEEQKTTSVWLSMNMDIKLKRAKMVGKVKGMVEEIRILCIDFYGKAQTDAAMKPWDDVVKNI